MSRIGRLPITVPAGVKVDITAENVVTVTGPLGTLKQDVDKCIAVELKELEGKVSDDEKAKVEAEIANVKKALEGTDTEAIKAANEKLTQVFYEISQKLYAEAAKNAEANNAGSEDVVHDADYKVEDESENK